jgi:hypothetical protein
LWVEIRKFFNNNIIEKGKRFTPAEGELKSSSSTGVKKVGKNYKIQKDRLQQKT